MNKKHFYYWMFLLILMICGTLNLNAQNEQKGFSFQGYARDFSGAAYSSSNITAQFSIYPEGESVEYTEQHSLTTDPYGVFHAIVGSITPVNFSALDFSSKKYFMKTEVKVAGGDFVEISDTELLAVPYAKAADKAVSASNGVPPGTILPFGGPFANIPAGYLACDGDQVASATYPELYNAIANSWGGDATNFKLPDLRGQFLRGQDSGAGVDPDVADRTDIDGNVVGDVVGSFQADTLKNHQHNYQNRLHWHVAGTNNPGNYYGPPDTQQTSAYGGSETRPKNAYVLYIIKY